MTYLDGKSILITGGTVSFGKAFVTHALKHFAPERVIIFSRDELKQYEFRAVVGNDPRVRWFIGDVREEQRLRRAMVDVQVVVHTAALKQVETAEYNPFECVQTNVIGAENVISAAIDSGVEKVIALSTDKASSPVNLYGASKLCSDKLFIAGNHYSGRKPTRFSVVRYGNVVGSRGSVVPFFRRLASEGRTIPVTDLRMTRFWITLPQAVQFVLDAFGRMHGGELFVPRIPSMRVTDLAEALAPGAPIVEVGIRPGEKLHEEMISPDDARRTVAFADHFVVQPVLAGWSYQLPDGGEQLPEGFQYASNTNDEWLTVDELREMANAL